MKCASRSMRRSRRLSRLCGAAIFSSGFCATSKTSSRSKRRLRRKSQGFRSGSQDYVKHLSSFRHSSGSRIRLGCTRFTYSASFTSQAAQLDWRAPESSLFESADVIEGKYLLEAEKLAAELGVLFDASGAGEPEASLRRLEGETPWSLCRRPWSLMYFTAHGRALPCCIAPFSMRGYENFTLGDAKTTPLRDIWNGAEYQSFREALLSDTPPQACAGCGLRWSL